MNKPRSHQPFSESAKFDSLERQLTQIWLKAYRETVGIDTDAVKSARLEVEIATARLKKAFQRLGKEMSNYHGSIGE